MPNIETQDFYQKILVWSPVGPDDYGRLRVGDRQELNVRYESTENKSRQPVENERSDRIIVYVDREIQTGSIVWLGSLDDVVGSPQIPEGDFYEVVEYKSIPDIKNRFLRRSIVLGKYGDQISIV